MWNESFSYSIIQRGNAGGRQKKVIFRPQFWAWGLSGPAERQRGLMQTGDCKWDTKICIHTPIHYRKLGGETEYSSASSLYFLSSGVSFFFDFQFHPSVLIAQKVISCLCLSAFLTPSFMLPLAHSFIFSILPFSLSLCLTVCHQLSSSDSPIHSPNARFRPWPAAWGRAAVNEHSCCFWGDSGTEEPLKTAPDPTVRSCRNVWYCGSSVRQK